MPSWPPAARLASRLHQQLPLSPRESQQLLNLLTASFRSHLDREHPVAAPDPAGPTPRRRPSPPDQHNASPARPESSYRSATQHIDAVLSNPLLAVKPRHRQSELTAAEALRDPLTWFLDHVAKGTASFTHAAMCLDELQRAGLPAKPHDLRDARRLGASVATWLQSSGLENSRDFITSFRPAGRLVPLLVAEGEEKYVWRWLLRSPEQWAKETGLEVSRILAFRSQLLKAMIGSQAERNMDRALANFLQAHEMTRAGKYNLTRSVLQPTGAALVTRISTSTLLSSSPELFESFLKSSRYWLGRWYHAVEAMLWLHHPTNPTAIPGLAFIRDPAGAIAFVDASTSRQRFLVQLSLGVARHLLAEQNYGGAHAAMDFTQKHFANIVLGESKPAEEAPRKNADEQANLELLDRLLPV